MTSSPETVTKAEMMRWLETGIDAVDPEHLVVSSLGEHTTRYETVLAIGKGAAAMCRGAARAMGAIRGICVVPELARVPEDVDLVVGDHPVPGEASFEAGRRVLDVARTMTGGGLALVSGGGSALCEWPRRGVPRRYLQEACARLLDAGTPIATANIVRSHLSAIKSGGLADTCPGRLDTLILSDVPGDSAEVVASGPTLRMRHAPEEARATLHHLGMGVPDRVWEAMSVGRPTPAGFGNVGVVGDGHTAARAICAAARAMGHPAHMAEGWITGEVGTALAGFIDGAIPGLNVAAGEPDVEVARQGGMGGRNTHTALLAAQRLAGSRSVFAALATDGVDGASDAAGAIVDGDTLGRGGDPGDALARFDSASYLVRSGDLVRLGATGTNVSDIWVLWRE